LAKTDHKVLAALCGRGFDRLVSIVVRSPMDDLSDKRLEFYCTIISIDAAITIFWRTNATFFSKK
jgi:hypothetical protein